MAAAVTRYLVSGATGFVGAVLCAQLLEDGQHVTPLSREGATPLSPLLKAFAVRVNPDFADLAADWPIGRQCDVAIHLASRVHVMQESSRDVQETYRRTNVTGSLNVAAAAAKAGARRFVFVSSVKAMGDTEPGSPARPWCESDQPMPTDPYGTSKWEAEKAVRAFCEREGMEWTIIRPPLVYGPHVRANFRQLLAVVARRVPLPLASVTARRSMIFIDNLISAIRVCADHPLAARQTFFVSDGMDFTVADIVRSIGLEMGRPARVFRCPPALLACAARLTGRTEQAERLLNPLRVNIEHIRAELAWAPPLSVDAGLRQTAIWYRDAFLTQSPPMTPIP
jgi:UDP-glucose 4-epimerase